MVESRVKESKEDEQVAYNFEFLPRTFVSDGIVDGVISGSGLILKMRWGGGKAGKCGSSINPSWVLCQQAEFSVESL